MNYKTLVKNLCVKLVQYKNTKDIFVQQLRTFPENLNYSLRRYVSGGSPGSGAGKGGGGGGSIREAGGGLGRFGAAQEEGYFFQKQREQLKKLRDKLGKLKSGREIKQKPGK